MIISCGFKHKIHSVERLDIPWAHISGSSSEICADSDIIYNLVKNQKIFNISQGLTFLCEKAKWNKVIPKKNSCHRLLNCRNNF
mmetsp:Transcript_12381/g.17201  ORF Transcript_12381/g.17201 Transcript_12381/m.17201 type:complete len:84 (+) Transcript_12381:2109-2360(+)